MKGVLALIGDPARLNAWAAALEAEGLSVIRENDLTRAAGAVDPALVEGEAPALILLGGAPTAVLAAAVGAFRRDPKTKTSLLLVADDGVGLNERAKLLNAGADDVQPGSMSAAIVAARVRNLLRRAPASSSGAGVGDSLALGPIRLDAISRSATLEGVPLRLTRLQFDFLAALARMKTGASLASVIETLAAKGHALTESALLACLAGTNREIVLHGWELSTEAGGIALNAASRESRLPALAQALAQTLASALGASRLYHEGHQAVVGFAARARELIEESSRCLEGSRVRVEFEDGRLLVGGAALEDESGPDPLVEFLRAYGLRALAFDRGLSAGDLMGLLLLAKLDALGTRPADPAAHLAGAGVSTILLERAVAFDPDKRKALAREFARRMSEERGAVAELFSEKAVFVLRARGKERRFEDRDSIAGFLASFPAGLRFEITGIRGEGDVSEASCVVEGPDRAPVKDEYSFVVSEGRFTRFEAVSRLRI